MSKESAPIKTYEIVELEKKYGVILNFSKYKKINDEMPPNSYALSAGGSIIALAISGAQIDDIGLLCSFKKLKYLDLTSNRIKDINPIVSLVNLQCLFLGGNRIEKIDSIANLKNLVSLALWQNPIEDCSIISKLNNIEELYCQDANLKTCDFISNLSKLKNIAFDGNQIEDCSPILGLKNLETAIFRNNLIKDISCLHNLKTVANIDFTGNLIKEVQYEIAEKLSWLEEALISKYASLSTGHKFKLRDNPLEFPPLSVVSLGKEIVKNYYETSAEYGHAPLSEGRIIVVGDGSAGKSSLIERILHNTFEVGKNQTNGIKIEHWKLKHEDGRDLTFHIWDFRWPRDSTCCP